jgi:hypothetical protein
MEAMMQMFQNLVSPEQREVAAFIKAKGGDACLQSEEGLKELMEYEDRLVTSAHPEKSSHFQANNIAEELMELRREVDEQPDEAIEKNGDLFARKFDMQQRQAEEETARSVGREGDRDVSASAGLGPHEKILDPVRITGCQGLTFG